MKNFILSLAWISLLTVSSNSWATAMSPERSKCYSMQSISREYSAWKSDYRKFLEDSDSLTSDLRHRASVSAMTKLTSKLVELKRIGDVKGYDGVIADANRLISDINSGNITAAGAVRPLKTGLGKLEEAMDDVVYQAQVKNDCQLEPTAAAQPASAASSVR